MTFNFGKYLLLRCLTVVWMRLSKTVILPLKEDLGLRFYCALLCMALYKMLPGPVVIELFIGIVGSRLATFLKRSPWLEALIEAFCGITKWSEKGAEDEHEREVEIFFKALIGEFIWMFGRIHLTVSFLIFTIGTL